MLKVLKYLPLFVMLLISGMLFSQEEEEEIEEEEIIEEEFLLSNSEQKIICLTDLLHLLQSKDEIITISNYEIIVGEQDKDLMKNKIFFKQFEICPEILSPKEFVLFHNCKFNLGKKEYLVFKNWEIKKLEVVGCDFLGRVCFENSHFNNNTSFFIENSFFYDQLKISSNLNTKSYLELKNNDFKSEVLIAMNINELVIDTCRFVADSILLGNRVGERTFFQLDASELSFERIEMTKNVFDNNGLENIFSINLESTQIGELKMISNKMQILNLTDGEVVKSLLIDSLFVDDYIGILNFDFPQKNTNIPWYNFGNEKFSIFSKEENFINAYQAKTHDELADNLMYNDLMSAYNKFNILYHDRGDIISANESYVEIKDIETRRQAFIQEVKPSFNNLINYNLNVFLKIFSDYATNPGKSLKYSLRIMLLFAFLYMITFSRWDRMDYKFCVNQFNKFSEYIISNKHINEIYGKDKEGTDEDIADVVEFLAQYKGKGRDVPRILKLFGKPLQFMGKFRFSMIPSMIKLFNFQEKAWSDFKTFGEKFKAGSLIVLISLSFVIYVFVVKFVNSLILSVNSFMMIGYGGLPDEGEWFAMSISIIEGVIGWFLLTIFTITLLSQVLQGA
jgi:hypothetical protein